MAMALSLLLLLSLPSSPRAVADTATVSVNLSSGSPRHPLNPLHFGCHMDLGFAHPARGIYSQLLFGGSFEFGLAGYGDIPGPEHDGHTDIRAAALHGIVWNALLPGNTTTAPALALVAAAPSPPCTTTPQPCQKTPGHTYCASDPSPGQCARPAVATCPPCPPGPGPPPPATGGGGTVSFDNSTAHHGIASLKLSLAPTTSSSSGDYVGASNRGMGNEGLSLIANTTYEGYFYVRADASAKMAVLLRNHREATTLARQDLVRTRVFLRHVILNMIILPRQARDIHREDSNEDAFLQDVAATGGAFVRVNFSFVTSAAGGTECEGIAPGSDHSVDCGQQCVNKNLPPVGPAALQNRGCMAPPANNQQGHICIRCAGEFVVALTSPGSSVHVDYVFLQPGRELRVVNSDGDDLPFLKSGADTLQVRHPIKLSTERPASPTISRNTIFSKTGSGQT